jgi:hypothetical protein
VDGAWWDPFSAAIARTDGGSHIALDLAPYESRIVVFSQDRPSTAPESASSPAVVDIGSGWKVGFAGSPQTVAMDRLVSWTTLDAEKYFSGQATYEKTVMLDATFVKSGRALRLDFGEGSPVTVQERRSGSGMRAMLESPVREAAVVTVNGKPAGSVWHPPYELDMTALLHPGENTIRVTVANLAINELAHQPPPDYRALIQKYGDRFQDQDMQNLQPLPSGLLGPVRLLAK